MVLLAAQCYAGSISFDIATDRYNKLKYHKDTRILMVEWRDMPTTTERYHYVCVYIHNILYSPNPAYDQFYAYDPILGDKKIPIRYREWNRAIHAAQYLLGENVKNAYYISVESVISTSR